MRTDLSAHWNLFWAQPWPSPRAFLACFSDFCPQEGQQQKPRWFSGCGIIFHRCPHRLCMGHGPVTLLDVLILLPEQNFCNLLQKKRERESFCRPKQRDSIATGRHVQTIPSTSSPCGSGDSLQQHIIITILEFNMESSPPPPPSSLTFKFFKLKWLFVKSVFSFSIFRSLRHVVLFPACMRFDGSRKGELHSVWSLHDCGFWFRVESWRQDDRKPVTEMLLQLMSL